MGMLVGVNDQRQTILFVGGGSGGHIFPNLAVWERVHAMQPHLACHFVVSDRALDRQVMEQAGESFTTLPARPWALRPRRMLAFVRGYRQSTALVRRLLVDMNVTAVVGTGGFVCPPVFVALKVARGRGRSRWRGRGRAAQNVSASALVNLDAVPGKANRLLAARAGCVFSVYANYRLPGAQLIGLPMRHAALATVEQGEARQQLGLAPDRPTLLVFAGSQGGASINQMMMQLVGRAEFARQLSSWQVIHITGAADQAAATHAYDQANIASRVDAFCEQMGLAWSSSSLCICRAGAGSVAEAWAHGVPTVFLPYPYHRDDHQKHNASPLVAAGGALCLSDRKDAGANADQMEHTLGGLLSDAAKRQQMAQCLEGNRPDDGAAAVANWVVAAG
jgi:UDP-N-acetylglucosamine--N-acetylmuramyl-(pentapeptide) pyrophosphoryl-undecaprenol N-acetylglucosamine transferase